MSITSIPCALNQKPGDETKKKIGKAVFGATFVDSVGLQDLGEFFDYYEGQRKWLKTGKDSESHQTTGLTAQTHEDIITVIGFLRKDLAAQRESIRTSMLTQFRNAELVGLNRSIDIALRMWLMINVREEEFRDLGPGIPCVQWNDDASLANFVMGLFPISRFHLSAKESRLSPYFTAAFMVEICGLTVHWTTSLTDHLRLDRVRRVLWVFPYKRCLQAHLANYDLNTGCGG